MPQQKAQERLRPNAIRRLWVWWMFVPCAWCGLTTQAQRPGPRGRWIATRARWPGSLQRMVRRRGHTQSIQLPNVVVWIRVLFGDGAWLLREQKNGSQGDEHRLRNEQRAAKPLQVSERLWPAIPKREGSAHGYPQPDDGQETEEARPRSADGLAREPSATVNNLCARFHARCVMPPNDPSSATRPTRCVDCNSSAMAGFAAAHG